MPLAKLKIAPGFNYDSTFYSNTGGWYDGDKVRFRNGLPEKIGGWQKFTTEQYLGTCRNLFNWAALSGTVYTAIGTNVKYYLAGGDIDGLRDVTPIVSTTDPLPDGVTGADSLTTTSGSNRILIRDTTYTPISGQYIIISGVTGSGSPAALNGIPITEINGEHSISEVVDATTYYIDVTTNATSSGTGGGSAVIIEYELSPGLDSVTFNTGWGVGPWGGATSPVLAATLTDEITTTNGSSTITINWASHGIPSPMVYDYYVLISGVSVAVGDIPAVFLNGAFKVASVVDANNITVVTAVDTALPAITVTAESNGGGTFSIAYWSSETSTGWGNENNGTTASEQLRLWTTDNYGEKLITCVRNGGIYHWSPEYGPGRLETLEGDPSAVDAPTVSTEIMMSDIGQHLIAFGADPWTGSTPTTQDKMNIRWSDSEDIYNWDEADTTKLAGSVRLGIGSFIMTAAQSKDEIIIWTDAAMYSMKPSGDTNVFDVSLIATNTNLIGPNAKAIVNNTAFWMGTHNFYYYDGAVYTLPSTVRDRVFLNINMDQSYKVFAGKNAEFNEITWYYPSANSEQNDSYVTFNYVDKVWYFGSISRTAWLDAEFNYNPLGATPGTDGYVYQHEIGQNDGSGESETPIYAWALSSPVEIEDGDSFSFVRRILPDVSFRNSQPEKTMTFTIFPQNYPGAEIGGMDSNLVNLTAGQSYNLGVYTDQVYTRLRGRSVILKVESNDLDISWRVGTPRLEIIADGRR